MPHSMPIGKGVLLALSALVSSCTLIDPVQRPAPALRLAPPLAGASSPVAAAGEPTVSDATAIRVQVAAPCVDLVRCGAGGISEALQAVEEIKIQYQNLAADSANLNTRYNAGLWPLAGLLLHEPLAGRQPILPAAAVLGGTYGVVNSGVADRAARYQSTAARLQCAISVARAKAYLHVEIEGDGGKQPASMSLAKTASDLQASWIYVANARAKLRLPLNSTPTPVARGDSLSRRPQGSIAVAKDPNTLLNGRLDALLAKAQDVGGKLDGMLERVRAHGPDLRSTAQQIELADGAEMIGKMPGLKTPSELLNEIAAIKTQMSKLVAQGEERATTTLSDAEAFGPLIPDAASSARLNAEGKGKLEDFEKEVDKLRAALLLGQKWIARDQEKLARLPSMLDDNRSCPATLVTFASSTPSRTNDRPATAATQGASAAQGAGQQTRPLP